MKPLFLAAAALVAITASALDAAASNPSYHGHKVFRIPVADEEDGLLMQNLVDKLGLAVWQPPSKKGAFADMQVPADQLRAFGKAMEHRNVIIMHEDLGKSIRNESKFHDYAGKSSATSYHAGGSAKNDKTPGAGFLAFFQSHGNGRRVGFYVSYYLYSTYDYPFPLTITTFGIQRFFQGLRD